MESYHEVNHSKSEHVLVAVDCKNCGWVDVEDTRLIKKEDYGFEEKPDVQYKFKCFYCGDVSISKIRRM